MMHDLARLYAPSAVTGGSNFRRFAPFALALLITAGAQAATVSSTLTLTGTTTISASGYVNSGQITLTGVGSGTFASTIPISAITGATVTANFTITLSGGTLIGTYTEPASILFGGSGNASATITGGTGSYAGYTGSFPTLAGSSTQAGITFNFTFTGAGTVNTAGGGTTTPIPTIASVTDGASYTANVAQGGFFTVWGSNLAPSSSGLTDFPRPTVLANGVKVTFTPIAGGTPVNTYLIYVGTGQINGLLPSTVPVGSYNVTVTNGTVSAPSVTQVVVRKPGLFTQDQSGTGLAVVFTYISPSESDVDRLTTGNYNGSLSSPAKPGQTLVAWGTGIGPYQAGDNTAGISHDFSTSEPIAAIVGGVSIPVVFAGLNGYAGEDQINFTLPANVPTGCAVSLQISVNGVLSAPTSIAIAPSAGDTACVQPGYTTQQLVAFDQGATITTGGFGLEQIAETVLISGSNTSVKFNSISGAFSQINGFQLAAAGTANVSVTTSGSCQVFHVTTTGSAVSVGHVTDLDAGTVTLNGPAGTGLNNQKLGESGNTYSYTIGTEGITIPGQANGTILAGTYALNGAGGTDVGPFNTSITIGSPLTLNPPLPTTVTESAGLTLNWTGGNSSDVVEIMGASAFASGTGVSQVTDTTEFVCVTTAGQKTFTVPASILTQLPTITAAQVAANTAAGLLELVSGPPTVNFNATLKKDGSVIPSVFSSFAGIASVVVFQ
jgi:uncharacterized protein (TIGR03437 family)